MPCSHFFRLYSQNCFFQVGSSPVKICTIVGMKLFHLERRSNGRLIFLSSSRLNCLPDFWDVSTEVPGTKTCLVKFIDVLGFLEFCL